MKKLLLSILLLALTLPVFACKPAELHIVTTGDIHGRFFSRAYTGDNAARVSLMSVKHYVDRLRDAVGPSNVILLDCGDILQGDNASYYYNYVATDEPHVYPRMAQYMGYDACTVGNHDIETGHPVYDRVFAQMKAYGIPWLSGNAFKEDGSLYFPEYTMLHKGGKKVLVLGYNNANIDNWLPEEYWSGMTHKSLIPLVQDRVDRLRIALKPDVVIVMVHSGTGNGDGSIIENQGLDIFNDLHGVDVLVCGHDHLPGFYTKKDCVMVDGGARCSNVGHAVLKFRLGKVTSRTVETVPMKRNLIDPEMEKVFDAEWRAVKSFTNSKVGTLTVPLRTRDAYEGMCDYIDLIHTVQLGATGAQLSLAAPLSFNGTVNAGDVIFDDMFTIYPYENQLYVLSVTGKEVKNLMEYSYDKWICTPGDHVLRIQEGSDPRSGATRWSFENRSYNFDSVAGLVYTVDVTKPAGSRVEVVSLADGSPFDESATYTVAMTSYRATGGGSLVTVGAGIPHSELAGRVVAKYPEIRDFVYKFIASRKVVEPSSFTNREVLGSWEFVPRDVVEPLMAADMDLMF